MKTTKKCVKVLISSLIASSVIFIPAAAAPHTTEAAATVETASTVEATDNIHMVKSAGTVTSDVKRNNLNESDYSDIRFAVQYNQKAAKKQLNMINTYRASYSSSNDAEWGKYFTYAKNKTLKWDSNLEKLAMQRAAEICLVFEHTRPNGEHLKTSEYGYMINGENIACGFQGTTDEQLAQRFLDGFISSKGHRRNILSAHNRNIDFDSVGIAILEFNGKNYCVQIFGQLAKGKKPVNNTFTVNNNVTIEYAPNLKFTDYDGINTTMKERLEPYWKESNSFTIKDTQLKDAKDISLNVGDSVKFDTELIRTAKENGSDKKITANVRPESSNENIVSVREGTIIAKAKGTAKISFFSDPIHGTKKTITVTVGTKSTGISIREDKGIKKSYKGTAFYSYTGLVKDSKNGKWYYMEKGVHNKTYIGAAPSTQNPDKLYFIKNGEWNKSYTGLAKYSKDGSWYYMNKGTIDKSFTGISGSTKKPKGKFYVKAGKWQSNYSGKVKINNKTYTIKNGQVV